MNLIIDVGNTLVKMAVFNRDEIIHRHTSADIDSAAISLILKQFSEINACIIGSVRDLPEGLHEMFPASITLTVMGPETKLPLRHQYKTFKTLGVDRMAGAVAASGLYPGKNILLIMAGTCITYDFIDANGIYHGGGISPGIALRLAALHNFTDKLPLINAVKDPTLIGNTTESSIQSGVINGVKAEVRGIISEYESNYENLTIILSGGNLDYFDKILKNNIFAVPNIVLTGLNIILTFNGKN